MADTALLVSHVSYVEPVYLIATDEVVFMCINCTVGKATSLMLQKILIVTDFLLSGSML